MKKFYYSLFAAVSMMLAVTSCSQEEDFPQSSNEMTTFSVSLKGAVQSRAAGDGKTVDKLYCAVYQGEDTNRTWVYSKEVGINNDLTAEVTVPILKGEEYDIIFWAQKDGIGIYDISDLQSIKVNYTNSTLSNQESYDAFYNALNNFTADNKVHTIELRRPFAQLNLGTSYKGAQEEKDMGDWQKAMLALEDNIDPVTHSSVKIKGLANTFAPLTGDATGDVEVTFYEAKINGETFDVTINGDDKTYKNLSLNYLLVPCGKDPQGEGDDYTAIPSNEKALVDVTYTLYRGQGNELFTMDKIASVPVQRNYRTNIIGDLLTGTGFNVIIKPEDDKPATNLIAIAEGIVQDEATGVYYISSANGLSYASQNLFAQNGGSYVLTEDIDMTGATSVNGRAADALTYTSAALTHKMTTEKSFEFDGNGHSIKNLPGMFIAYTGSAKSVVVKNLTLDTPNVAFDVEDVPETNGVGAFIGYAGTTTTITLENCHVKGGKIEGGHWTGGLVGYAAGYSGNDGPVFETLTIKDCSVKNATVTGKGSIGGIIGHATGDAWTLVDMDNINVTSNTIISTGSSNEKAGSVMGTLGTAGTPKTVNGVTKVGGTTIDSYEVSGNRVESNKVANTKLWGRQAGGVLTLDGTKVEDFGSYTEPASEFTYENGIYTLQKITASALTDILADAETNSYGDITIQLAEDQALSWAAGPAGGGANKLAHEGKVTIKNGTLSVTGAGSFVVENELELDGVTVVDNTAYYAENGETAWEFCYLELKAKGTYKNCIFENTIKVDGQEATFANCKFLGKSTNEANADGEYAVWVYNGEAKFVECEFTGARGMKICDYYSGADVTAVEIDNCKFNGLSKKPGLAIDERQGTKMDVTIKNSTFTDVQPGDQGLYIYETDNVVPTITNSKVIVGGIELFGFDAEGNYSLTTAEGLKWFANKVNQEGVTFSGKTVTLGNNIDLNNETWTPIGDCNSGKYFQGIFDGKSFTISNLKVDNSTDGNKYSTAGLFGWIDKNMAIIKNVKVNNATVKGSHWVGVIAGYATGRIENCSVTNATVVGYNVNDDANGDKVGGIVGFLNEHSYLNGNTVSASTITGNRDLGGIAGSVAASTYEMKNNNVNNVVITYSTPKTYASAGVFVSGRTSYKADNTNISSDVTIACNLEDSSKLNDVISSGATEISLPAGEYNLPSSVEGKTLTISGTEKTIIKTGSGKNSYVGLDGANITFEGVTIQGQKSGQYNGFAHAGKMTYKKCTFEGTITIYSNTTFEECTFNLPKDCYVWTSWGASEVTYEKCTFNTAGKALLMYHENGTSTLNVNNCTFNASESAKASAIANQSCAAIEIDNSGKGVDTNTACKFTLKTFGNTIGSNFSGEWRIKTIDTAGSINVNGTKYDTLALDGKEMTIDDNKNVTVQ